MALTDGARLQFEFDWEDAPGVRTPEFAATWARLKISVDGEPLTQVEDLRSRSARQSLYVPLYPLAEWVAFNWWALKGDVRPGFLSERTWSFRSRLRLPHSRTSWLLHHNLRAVGDGFPWPDLTILPAGLTTTLAWQGDRRQVPGWRVQFLSHGNASLPRAEVEEALAGLVEAVLIRLDEQDVRETPLAKEWDSLKQLDQDEVEFCMTAARLGLDPFAVPSGSSDAIIELTSKLEGDLLADFLDAADPDALETEAEWVFDVRSRLSAISSRTDRLPQIKPHFLDPAAAWEAGLADARQFRARTNLGPSDPVDIDPWVAVEPVPMVARPFQALGTQTTSDTRVLGLAHPKSDSTRRFASARALWRFLRAGPGDEFLITSARTPTQQAERAFAAELLAPAQGISALLGPDEGDLVDLDEVSELAGHFKVNDWVIQYQLINQLDRLVPDPTP